MNTKQTIGHWIFEHEFDPSEWFGFIYRIVELSTGRQYVGKKQFHQYLSKQIEGKSRRKRVVRESKWKTYTGSSTHLNEAIKTNDKSQYLFLIESLHKSKGSLYYAEVLTHITEDVLRTRMSDGITPAYYNRQISSVKFIPPIPLPEELQMTRKIPLAQYITHAKNPH